MRAAIPVSQCTIYFASHKAQGEFSQICKVNDVRNRSQRAIQCFGNSPGACSGAPCDESVECDPELIAELIPLHQDFVARARECADAPRS